MEPIELIPPSHLSPETRNCGICMKDVENASASASLLRMVDSVGLREEGRKEGKAGHRVIVGDLR